MCNPYIFVFIYIGSIFIFCIIQCWHSVMTWKFLKNAKRVEEVGPLTKKLVILGNLTGISFITELVLKMVEAIISN